MKYLVILCLCSLVACSSAIQASPSANPAALLRSSATLTAPVPVTPSSTQDEMSGVSTPMPSATPWVLPSGLSIEEHPLAKVPETDEMILHPLDSLNQEQMLAKHADEFQKSLPYESYYGLCFCTIWAMQGNAKLETMYDSGTPTPDHKILAGVTRDGKIIFSTLNAPPGTTNQFRVLTTYDNHWVLELAGEKQVQTGQNFTYSFLGEIFVDGKSLNELYGYDESFGFQTIHDRPFYFYKRNGKIGVSYDGREIPLGYDLVPHYGCCSGGQLNPRMAQNIVAFFGVRGEQWNYVEIGVFNSPNP